MAHTKNGKLIGMAAHTERVEFARGLADVQANPPDRHVALTDIKAILGDEAFASWYNVVYLLRAEGNREGYEQAIFAKLAELTTCRHPEDKIVVEQSGGLHFVGGDVIDTRQDHLLCTVCGETLPEVGGKAWFDSVVEVEF